MVLYFKREFEHKIYNYFQNLKHNVTPILEQNQNIVYFYTFTPFFFPISVSTMPKILIIYSTNAKKAIAICCLLLFQPFMLSLSLNTKGNIKTIYVHSLEQLRSKQARPIRQQQFINRERNKPRQNFSSKCRFVLVNN